MARPRKTVKDLRRHVKRRAYERFGWSLNDDEIAQVVKAIQANQGVFVERQSLILTLWVVRLRNTEVLTVYDSQRGMIRTVMPMEYLSRPVEI